MLAAMPAINTFKYVDNLKSAGVPEAQARATVQMVVDLFDDHTNRLATKDDIERLDAAIKLQGVELRGEMEVFRAEVLGQMDVFRTEVSGQMDGFRKEIFGQMDGFRKEIFGQMDGFRKEISGQMDGFRTEIHSEINTLRTEFRGEIKALRSEIGMVKWMSGPVALVALVWIAKEGLRVFGVTG